MYYMQPYEMDAWLGDTELTDDQRETFERAVDALAERYPGRDGGQHSDEVAIGEGMTGALMVILGDGTLENLGGAWARARAAEREAMAQLTGGMVAESLGGESEVRIAARAGATRMTVRKALGK